MGSKLLREDDVMCNCRMKLQLVQTSKRIHKGLVSSVGWSPANELYSCADDKTIHKWGTLGEHEGEVVQNWGPNQT